MQNNARDVAHMGLDEKLAPFAPFTTSLLGSLPRSRDLMRMRRDVAAGRAHISDLKALEERETHDAVILQQRTHIDVLTNGEFSRDNYVSFVADHLNGVTTMSMAEMLEFIEDKHAFEQQLSTLDVPATSIKNAICTGKISRKSPLVADEMRALKALGPKHPIKATLPGPYLLTRSMWLATVSIIHYESKEALGKDVLALLKQECDDLVAAGVDVVQFDEPVLTEVVFMEGATRSFMCASLAEKKDPTEELAWASELLSELMDYLRDKPIIASMHVCRGNWSRKEDILLDGPYTPLIPLFEEVAPDMLTLEYSTPRAGDIASLLESKKICSQSAISLGVVNPRSDEIEDVRDVVDRVHALQRTFPNNRIWLSPDCGFATFANRPMNTWDIVEKKCRVLSDAADILRNELS